MVTLVKDARSNVLHDCRELGCTVSWDGEVIDARAYAREASASDSAAASITAAPLDEAAPVARDAAPLKEGDRVPGAEPVDATVWHVRDNTATLREALDE